MNEEGRWITTKSGNRVFIKNNATNDYMNNKIRNSKQENKYNKKTFYHTSNHSFSEFDNEMPRKAILGGQYGYGHYFFDDKEISDGYGAYSKYQYEASVNVDKWFETSEKEFNEKLKNIGYNYEKDDIANFLTKKGFGGTVIEHTKPNGEKWYEYVVYDAKNIKIKSKKEQN